LVTYIVHQSIPWESGTHWNCPLHVAHDMPGHCVLSPPGHAWFVTGQLHEPPELLEAEVTLVLDTAVLAALIPPLPPLPPVPPKQAVAQLACAHCTPVL
jgi:hypothetical protein